MAPLVEMLPTNFRPVEPPSLDPESSPESEVEVEPDPEFELASELEFEAPEDIEAPVEEDEEPDAELEPDPELGVELPAAPDEPELDAGVAAPLPSAPESSPVPSPPLPLPWLSPDDRLSPDDPQATRADKAAIGKTWKRWQVRFINSAVAASGATRHENRGRSERGGSSRSFEHVEGFYRRDGRGR